MSGRMHAQKKAKVGRRPSLLNTFYLPRSGKPFKLLIGKDSDGYDAPTLDGGHYEDVLLRIGQGLDPRDKLELPHEEDRQYFIDVVPPQARKQVAAHYISRSDLGEWCDLMRHYPKKRVAENVVRKAKK